MKVFITREIPKIAYQLLEKNNHQVTVWNGETNVPTQDDIVAGAKHADALITMLSDKIDASFLEQNKHLKVISNYAVGFNNIDFTRATQLGIPIGNTPDVLTDATSDLAFALMLACGRRILDASRYITNRKWETWEPLRHLGLSFKKKTVGIVGMGRIGQDFAQKCKGAYDMDIIYTSRTPKEKYEKELGARRVDFETLLKESDVISVHTNLTNATKDLFDLESFRKMKSTALFINTARGGVHHEQDLIEALEKKEIWGAALDVTNPEPISINSPLLSMENVVVVPHIGSATVSTRDAMAEICAQNIIAGIERSSLKGFVNPEVYS